MSPCIQVKFGKHIGYVCYSRAYDYGGYMFEFHSYLGPMRISRKTKEPCTPRSHTKKFFEAFEEWNALSDKEKKKYEI